MFFYSIEKNRIVFLLMPLPGRPFRPVSLSCFFCPALLQHNLSRISGMPAFVFVWIVPIAIGIKRLKQNRQELLHLLNKKHDKK
jgi:hypothetical protein